MGQTESFVICHLCRKPVELVQARVDEQGQAVHQECYVRALTQGDSALMQKRRDPGHPA